MVVLALYCVATSCWAAWPIWVAREVSFKSQDMESAKPSGVSLMKQLIPF